MSWLLANPEEMVTRTVEHVRLVGLALVLALAIALPLGIAVASSRRWDLPVLGTLSVVYTIPSLALFILLVPFLGLGPGAPLVALILYAQVVLVRSVVTGLRGVDPGVREAARGMGMTPGQQLWRVDLPLALPVILAGIRLAVVSTLGLATLAALVQGGGLGVILFRGLSHYDPDRILAGAIAVTLLALAANLGIRAVERRAEWVAGGHG
jgi:osmoprotectant transport system permease protein